MDGQEFVEGAEVQESTAPASTETEPVNPTTEESAAENAAQAAAEPNADDANKKTERDSIYAEARRSMEAKLEEERAKLAEERKAIDAEFKRLFGKAVDPKTNKPIESAMDYIRAFEEQQRRDDEEELRAAGITNERFAEMVRNLPEYKRAMEANERVRKADEERYFGEALKEIQKMDPSVKTREDLEKHESYKDVYDLVMNHGLTLERAFKYANADALSAKRSAAAQQAAVNQAKGKSHLEATQTGYATNQELIDMPESTMAEYRKFYPNLTDDQRKVKFSEHERKK